MFFPSERLIFGPYHNGVENVYADPLHVYRVLQFHLDGDANTWLVNSRSQDEKSSFLALEKVLKAASVAFGFSPFDTKTGEGVLEEEIIGVLNLYLEFMHAKKEKGQSLRICSLPTPSSAPKSQTTPST